MKETNHWEQFISTGSIKDYMEFKQTERTEVYSYAGDSVCNRNDIEDGADRGLR